MGLFFIMRRKLSQNSLITDDGKKDVGSNLADPSSRCVLSLESPEKFVVPSCGGGKGGFLILPM